MTTPGNPLFPLSQPPGPGAPKKHKAIGKIGHWSVYQVKRGGMGDVYICGISDSEAEYALKSFQPRLFFDPESRRAFLREITIWLRLTGTPFIMPALRIEEHEGRLFVVMAAIDEDQRHVGTVADLIGRKAGNPVEAFTIAWQLAIGMKLAGDAVPGVSHGDLKPANILYNGGPVLISDFGLAAIGRIEGKPLRTTPEYEAPEYASTGPTPATDVYSTGVILSELAESCPGPKASFFHWKKSSDSSPILLALKELAQGCCTKDPKHRPSFDEIVQKLGQSVQAHRNELGEMFVNSGALYGAFREMQAALLPDIAEGLLKIDAPAQALEIIDSIKEDVRSGKALVLKGTSLSLLDRDQEALQWFEKALKDQMQQADRLNCLSEYALSLKRVGRLKDAEEIYSELLGNAKDAQLAKIVVNLAGVYAEGEKHLKAADLLSHFIRTHHDEPLAFAALGNAYVALGQYDDAASQYQRALVLAPHLAHIQVAFARVCLQNLGRWEDAGTALFAAHQQGYMSREWLLLALVSSTLTGHKGDADELMKAARRDLPGDEVDRLDKEAVEMTIAVLRKQANKEDPAAEATSTAATPDTFQTAKDFSSPDGLVRTASLTGNSSISPGKHFEPAALPFFNVMFYLPENRFAFDFYDDIDRKDYADRFVESLNLFQRNPDLNRNAELRPTPLYFHVCPSCGVHILTNRDEGSGLNCRQCDVRNSTRRVDTESTRQVISLVHQALRKTLTRLRGLRLYLMVQPVENSPAILDALKQICREEGFEHFAGADSPLGFFCKMRLRTAGVPLDERREIITVSKLSLSDELSYAGDTPPETDRVVRRLRELAPIRSASVNFDPDSDDPLSLFFGGKSEEMEQRCRRAVENSPEDIEQMLLLIEVLRASKKSSEAKALALRAIVSAPQNPNSWVALGRSERDLGEYTAAISHLNKAISLDPLTRGALVDLFLTYKKTGDTEKAQEMRSRIEALGGPMLSA
ncbi:tetratricopeptide repeat protein [Paraburkholderia sp. 1N]|uniref:Tetratricopeptide repeat protein n=1 Tax=Paraburkholderia solitsugae TaxID=2675748 RepID=A0ABX2C2C6_9BURK|nr:protein kinase family protein [Paraburkholderia solitsugae]NPT47177.1 tetratricopeptide repeat protein [Paraburkholderia solitsugae]